MKTHSKNLTEIQIVSKAIIHKEVLKKDLIQITFQGANNNIKITINMIIIETIINNKMNNFNNDNHNNNYKKINFTRIKLNK